MGRSETQEGTPGRPRSQRNDRKLYEKPKKKCGIYGVQMEKKNLDQEMYHFLREHRTTPNTITGQAPAEILYGTPYQTRLLSMPAPQTSMTKT